MFFIVKPERAKLPHIALFLVVAIMPVGLSFAEDVRYVTDQLILKMYKDSALSEPRSTLKTGDRLVILQQDDGYAQVETLDGTVGWVKSSYLHESKPAILRLAEVQEELDNLRSEHTDLILEQPAVITDSDSQLKGRVEAAESAHASVNQRVKQLDNERIALIEELRALRQADESKGGSKYVLLWIILPILTLISGFFAGFKFLEGKIKLRFGGHNPL